MNIIDQIHKLTLHEKLHVMEALWDDISRTEAASDVPQWHKDILDERDRLVAAGSSRFIDWEDAKKQIRQLSCVWKLRKILSQMNLSVCNEFLLWHEQISNNQGI